MAFPGSFHRIVILGNQFADTFATGLTVAASDGGSMSAADQALADEVRALVGNWWSTSSGTIFAGLPQQAILTSVKVNRINTEGLYQDPETIESIFPTPVPGPAGAGRFPAQLATVATLRTAVERGRASKGRMFLPACTGFISPIGTDGRATTGDALRVANAVKTLVDGINLIYASPPTGVPGRVSVMSNIGAGLAREVTGTSVGRVTDTMRSRRSKLQEDPQFDTV